MAKVTSTWENHFCPKVGEYIRWRREEIGLKQQDVANMVGITQSYYSNIESGKREPSLRVITKICDVVKLDVGEVVRFAKRKKPPVTRFNPMLSMVDKDDTIELGSGSGKP